MKYRVRLDLILDEDNKTLANTIYTQMLARLKDHAKVIAATQEHSFIELEECHHDESPIKPCKVLKHREK